MDYLMQTAKILTGYLIISSAIRTLAQGTVYSKYVDFILRLLMILMVLQPVLDVLSKNGDWENKLSYELIYNDILTKEEEFHVEENWQDQVFVQAGKIFEEQIRTIAEKNGMEIESVTFDFCREEEGFGTIISLCIEERGEVQMEKEHEFLRMVSEQLGITEEIIELKKG